MSTTVRELIAYLEGIPADTDLRVVVTYECPLRNEVCTKFVPLDLDPSTGNVEFIDMTSDRSVAKGSKKYLDFGEI